MMKAMPHVASYTKSLHIACDRNRSPSHQKKLAKVLSSFGRITRLSFVLVEIGFNSVQMEESEVISSVQYCSRCLPFNMSSSQTCPSDCCLTALLSSTSSFDSATQCQNTIKTCIFRLRSQGQSLSFWNHLI